MRTVYVVVHPEATHHVEDVVGGWHDSHLTAAGSQAAAAIADELRATIPDDATVTLFSSDLQRTRETAQAIGERLGVTPILDRRLREKSYGEAEGRSQRWLDQRFVPPPAHGDRMVHGEGISGAESKAEFAKRIYAAMDTILEGAADHQIVVTHGFAANFVVTCWIGMPMDALGYAHFRTPSGSITVLREDDFFHNRAVITLGDTAHLQRLDRHQG